MMYWVLLTAPGTGLSSNALYPDTFAELNLFSPAMSTEILLPTDHAVAFFGHTPVNEVFEDRRLFC